MNKKFLIGTAIVLTAGTLSGCSVHFDKDGIKIGSETKTEKVTSAKKETSKKQSSSSSSKKASSAAKASSSKDKKSAKKEVKKTKPAKKAKKSKKSKTIIRWNKKKAAQLDSFINTWSASVSQVYQKYDGINALKNIAGTTYPDVFMQRQFVLNDKNITLAWSPQAKGDADYKVVAIYNDDFKDKDWHLTYLFCIHDNKPVVLLDQGKDVNPIILTKARDKNLQAGFAKIAK